MTSASGGRARRPGPIAHRSATAISVRMMRWCGRGCENWPPFAGGSAIDGCTSAKARRHVMNHKELRRLHREERPQMPRLISSSARSQPTRCGYCVPSASVATAPPMAQSAFPSHRQLCPLRLVGEARGVFPIVYLKGILTGDSKDARALHDLSPNVTRQSRWVAVATLKALPAMTWWAFRLLTVAPAALAIVAGHAGRMSRNHPSATETSLGHNNRMVN